ncbi:MAG: efflux RND transporter periplasmic adaptor subunit [Treponema sp.]|jgi:HlyD family secretion protein|nr:efflux RND transporter periplasmic adaptor subunit [Treponema sp.]
MIKLFKLFPYFMAVALLAGTGCLASGCVAGKKGNAKTYEFTAIRRGTLERTVSASGSLKPVATVNVLPRMSGKVEKINADYNDRIRKGDILAELNTDMLRLQREQQAAQVVKTRANYELQEINFQNQQRLAEKNLISEYELKTGKTNMDVQKAELSAAEASLRAIETEINQYAFITSPIDGIVLERNVNEGETVVDSSSGNSSSMFVIAENLEEMQIEAAVGELDITSISKGQEVRFTLESLPGKTFSGSVDTVRLMPSTQDNVVNYTVIINTENKDGTLLPGMTCSVEFIVVRNENILLVPNAALRYQPTFLSEEEIAGYVFNASLAGMDEAQRKAAIEARSSQRNVSQNTGGASSQPSQGGLSGLMSPGMPGGRMAPPGGRGNAGPNVQSGAAERSARGENQSPPRPLWYINDSRIDCVMVWAGSSDGSYTEVMPANQAGGTIEGMQIILREKI